MDQATLERAGDRLLPDLGLENPATPPRVLEALDGLGFEVTTGNAITSVVTDRGDPDGPTILLRADTDALPMTEEFAPWAVGIAEGQLGRGRAFELPTPITGAEDFFSDVLQRVPGAMAFPGACPTDIADSSQAPGCQSKRMRIDERAMAVGVACHVAVGTAYLEQRS